MNLDEELNNSFEISSNRFANARYVEVMSVPRLSFRDCCEKYAEIKPKPGTYSLTENEEVARLRALYPEACEAVDKIGIERIRVMGYRKANVLRIAAGTIGPAQAVKIKKELDRRLSKYQLYTLAEIKIVLGEIYEDVGLEKKPVATDLRRWYRLDENRKKGNKDAWMIEGDNFIIH